MNVFGLVRIEDVLYWQDIKFKKISILQFGCYRR